MKNLLSRFKLMFINLFSFKSEDVSTNESALLPLNLQFFADPGTDPQDPPAEPVDPPKTDPKNEPPADPKEHMIPKSRFDEINNNYKTTKEELDAIKKQQEQEELAAKKKQGEFEQLYNQTTEELSTYKTDFESTKTRVEQLEGVITSMLNTKLESIPEEYHDLIPDNLSPEQKLDWISKAETKGLFKNKSQEALGGSTNPSPASSNLNDMSAHQLLSAGYGSKK